MLTVPKIKAAEIKAVRAKAAKKFGHKLHTGEHLAHYFYLGAVFLEGHGLYPVLAGIGFIVVTINFILVAGQATEEVE